MASKIFTTQDWTLVCETEEDQSAATDKKIFLRSPSYPSVADAEKVAAVNGTNITQLFVDIAVDELDEPGDWIVWPKSSISGKVAAGDPAIVTIYEEGTI